jgi:hypothetical protein
MVLLDIKILRKRFTSCCKDRFRLPMRATIDNINAFIDFWMEFVLLRREIRKAAS